MKKMIAGVIAAGITLTSCGSLPTYLSSQQGIAKNTLAQASDESRDYSKLDEFSMKLWKNAANDTTNAISPFSAYIALAMCANGAAGETLAEFAPLGFTNNDNTELNAAIAALIKEVTSQESDVRLKIANSIWVDDSLTIKDEYSNLLTDYYTAELFCVDLPSSKDAANSWIEEKTNGLIEDMIDKISPDALLMLINTLYLNADWESEFNAYATHKSEFHAFNETRTEEFMHCNDSMRVIDVDDCVGVVLPYSGGRLEFCAVMPNDEALTTSELITRLEGNDSISDLARDAKSEQVILSLPKFEVKTSIALNETLQDMGLVKMFGSSADFSLITDSSDGIKVDDVLQDIYIRVDEKGTEAAAATVVIKAGGLAEPIEARELKFDRPFIWAIYDSVSGAVLFCGEYN